MVKEAALRVVAIEAVNALGRIRNLGWVPVTPEVCLKASVLVERYQLGPFDGVSCGYCLGL